MRSTINLATLLAAASLAALQTPRPPRRSRPLDSPSPAAAATARRQAMAVRLAGTAPKLDGVLDDAAWAQAQPVSDFVQRAPNPARRARCAPRHASSTTTKRCTWPSALRPAPRLDRGRPAAGATPHGHRQRLGAPGLDSITTAHRIPLLDQRRRRAEGRLHVQRRQRGHELGRGVGVGTRSTRPAGRVEYRIPLRQLRFGGDSSRRHGRGGCQVQRESHGATR